MNKWGTQDLEKVFLDEHYQPASRLVEMPRQYLNVAHPHIAQRPRLSLEHQDTKPKTSRVWVPTIWNEKDGDAATVITPACGSI